MSWLVKQGVISKAPDQESWYVVRPDTKYALPSVWMVNRLDELDRRALSDRTEGAVSPIMRLIRTTPKIALDLRAALREDW